MSRPAGASYLTKVRTMVWKPQSGPGGNLDVQARKPAEARGKSDTGSSANHRSHAPRLQEVRTERLASAPGPSTPAGYAAARLDWPVATARGGGGPRGGLGTTGSGQRGGKAVGGAGWAREAAVRRGVRRVWPSGRRGHPERLCGCLRVGAFPRRPTTSGGLPHDPGGYYDCWFSRPRGPRRGSAAPSAAGGWYEPASSCCSWSSCQRKAPSTTNHGIGAICWSGRRLMSVRFSTYRPHLDC